MERGRKGSQDDTEGCHFDFNVSDSDFDIPGEKTGHCYEGKMTAEEFGEGEEFEGEGEEGFEELTDYNPRKSSAKSQGVDSMRLHPLFCPPQLTPEEQYYKGLPSTLQKQFRTDYPTELQLKKVCTPRLPRRWKTVDNYKTEPIAMFSPVSSKHRLAKKYSLTDAPAPPTTPIEEIPAQQPKCQKTSRDPPPIVSISDEVVVSYLQDNNIQMMFEYFLGLCILNTPDDPFAYIADLADCLIKGRKSSDAFDEIPRLLSSTHVESMFRLYDRVGSGFISHFQYKNAMGSIGLVNYNTLPEGYMTDEITKDTFILEGKKAIDDLLRTFLFKRTEPQCF